MESESFSEIVGILNRGKCLIASGRMDTPQFNRFCILAYYNTVGFTWEDLNLENTLKTFMNSTQDQKVTVIVTFERADNNYK